MTHSTPVDHFTKLVPWSEFGPPLRPSPADISFVQRTIDEARPRRAVMLGLTPEIPACVWPDDVELVAVDHGEEMIRRMWPPPRAPKRSRVVLADWCAMPLPAGQVDLVVGDGCLTMLTHEGWRALAREVHRVLVPGGRFVLRVFLRPEVPEPVERIARELAEGRIRNINALKLRLWGAVHADGARLHDAWLAWSTMRREPGPGFSVEALAGLERYRGSDTRYFLGSASEVRALLGADFIEAAFWTPTGYDGAERCPTVVFRAG